MLAYSSIHPTQVGGICLFGKECGFMQTLEIGVRGMTCAVCAARIEKALKKIQGVALARVNLAAERARVEFDESIARPGELTAAIAGAGYTPVVEEIEI